MMKDLTNSQLERRNVLNNNLAVKEIYQQVGFSGVRFEGKYRFTKQQIAQFFEVDVRTIERLLENHQEELIISGYELFTGKKLKDLRQEFLNNGASADVSDIDGGDIGGFGGKAISNKAPSVGIFTFKSFLNVGMLLTVSDRAKRLRGAILNIVMDFLNAKLGGTTKFVNQREEEFLPSAIREYNYREEFTNALDYYIEPQKFKYGAFTDKIYKSIFNENAKEYKQILELADKESARATMYSEILDLVASFENGFAAYLRKESEQLGRKLRVSEAHVLFGNFTEQMEDFCKPLREKARTLMASRDMVFRDALHEKLKDYVGAVSAEDFDKFLGERSKAFELRLEENKEVFKRLKDR
ncbi:MAG: DNA-binding protein [Acidobacteriota bacterium]|nr:DNA-binding protein [Acidobacteriota bacterium]